MTAPSGEWALDARAASPVDHLSGVTIVCPAAREFVDHHPQCEDLLDTNRPGGRSQVRAGGFSRRQGKTNDTCRET